MKGLLWRARARLFGPGLLRNVCGTRHARECLLLSRVSNFRVPGRERVHQNVRQSLVLARLLSENGYNVDVADWDERDENLLAHDYDLVVDLHPVERPIYRDRLRPGAQILSYITGSDPAFSNAAERRRLDDLERRRGVRLRPRRQAEPFPKERFESFDAMLAFATPFALSTYSSFRLPPVHLLVNNGEELEEPTDPARRDPRRFLFLGSTGQVHKGLDLLLEVFAAEPDLGLVVCGPYARERDFVRAYRRELFETRNVQAAGFADVTGPRFRELQAGCGAMILPSCSEGQCGAITLALSFGIPVLASREAALPDGDVAVLPDCRLETLRSAVREWACRPAATVVEESRRAWSLARAKYRPAHYEAAARAALDAVLAAGGAPSGVGAIR